MTSFCQVTALSAYQHKKYRKKRALSHTAIIKLEQENIAQQLPYNEKNNASWNTVQDCVMLKLACELLGGSEDELMLLHNCLPTV